MGITGKIKLISSLTLDLLKVDPFLVEAFFTAECLPESTFWQAELTETIKQYARASFGNLPNGRNQQWKNTYDWQALEEHFMQEPQKPNPVPWLDWADEELLDWMVDYYNEILDYYETAVRKQKALLLYLI
jgi:hypothetical protein